LPFDFSVDFTGVVCGICSPDPYIYIRAHLGREPRSLGARALGARLFSAGARAVDGLNRRAGKLRSVRRTGTRCF